MRAKKLSLCLRGRCRLWRGAFLSLHSVCQVGKCVCVCLVGARVDTGVEHCCVLCCVCVVAARVDVLCVGYECGWV